MAEIELAEGAIQPRAATSVVPEARVASNRYRWLVLLLLLAVYVLNFMDRWIVTILGQPIKEELRLADWQLGLFNGFAFAALASTLGIPLARLAERCNRVAIISVCMVAWSALTAACGLAAGFSQLLLLRMGVGVGEAGCVPASHSLLADYFPPRMRASAHSVFGLGIPLGGLLGMIIGGYVADHWGWRAAFLVVGIPGVLFALFVRLLIREAPRGQMDSMPQGQARADIVPSMREVARLIWGTPTARNVLIAITLAVMFGNAATNFLPPYLVRRFGLSYTEVGLIVGVTVFATAGVGTLGGGLLADWAGRRDKRWYLWIPALSVTIAVPLNVIAYSRSSWLSMAGLILLPGVLMATYVPPSYAILHNIVEARMRATTSAIVGLLMSLIGVGCGSLLGGLTIDLLAAHLFGPYGFGEFAAACPGGLPRSGAPPGLATACHTVLANATQYTLIGWAPLMLLPAAFFFAGARTVRQDAHF